MNILILNWRDPKNPKSGGAEYVTNQHAKFWIKKGNNVTWFASLFKGAKKEEMIDGIRVVRRGGNMSVFFYAFLFYISSKAQYDVIVDEIHGIPFFTPLYVKKPVVAFIHEVAGEIWNYIYPFPLNHFGMIAERVSLSLYKNIRFWTDAPSTIDDLVQVGIRRGMCTPIACPVDVRPLRKLPQKELQPTFIFVGRLVPMKGAEDAILAFKNINETMKGSRLWIVGDGDNHYVERLKNRVHQFKLNDSIIFFGFVPEIKKLELLQRAHVLLHTSVKEGWGLVVLEAASQATPTVGYNVSGLRDTIHDMETGLLVDRFPLMMAKKAEELYEDKKTYTAMQEECLKFVKSFSWQDAGKVSLDLLTSVSKSP